ncbi:acyltransferase [Rhodobacteraceae bacterium CH30]|nr:acyltransferase [Rhodobacteraceae bacterium CH30]
MSKVNGGEFLYSFENMRAVAILFVIFSHFSSVYKFGESADIVKFILADATTLFVFISGYLFYYLSGNKGFGYLDYLGKKFKFVVLPFFFFSFFAILAGLVFRQNELYGLTPVAYMLWSFIVGGVVNGAMWFIPMICLFFLVSPMLLFCTKRDWFFVMVVAAVLFSVYSFRPVGNQNPVLSFFHFMGFYLMGMFFARRGVVMDLLRSRSKTVMAVSASGFFVLLVVWLGGDQVVQGYFDYILQPNIIQMGKLFFVVFLFFLFERFLSKKIKPMSYIANISFGLFFVHGFWSLVFLKAASYLEVSRLSTYFSLEFLFVFCFSVISIDIAKRILGARSRYVIGC